MTRIPDRTPPAPARTWRLGTAPWQAIPPASPARARVIIDNDFSGDPDDLYQLVHHLLSPSVEIPLVIASHLRPGDPFDPSDRQARNADLVVRDVFARLGLESTDVIVPGSRFATSLHVRHCARRQLVRTALLPVIVGVNNFAEFLSFLTETVFGRFNFHTRQQFGCARDRSGGGGAAAEGEEGG